MNMITSSKKAALTFSNNICKVSPAYKNILPDYFDWAEHIAVSEYDYKSYPYHLNNTAEMIIALTNILKEHIPFKYYTGWH